VMVLVDFQRRLYQYGGRHSLSDLPQVIETISAADQLEGLLENLKKECQGFNSNPAQRKIFILIDNYDTMVEANLTAGRSISGLAALVSEYQTAGLHLIGCGSLSILSSSEELRKVIVASSFGLGLQTADAVNRLNGKVPRSLAEVELPMGRGFIVKSGRTSMIQIATPYLSDDELEESLDGWVDKVIEIQGSARASWSGGTKPAPAKKGTSPQPQAEKPAATPASSSTVDPEKLEKAKLYMKEKGWVDTFIENFPAEELIKQAKSLGLDI
jgi:hypothetical protein